MRIIPLLIVLSGQIAGAAVPTQVADVTALTESALREHGFECRWDARFYSFNSGFGFFLRCSQVARPISVAYTFDDKTVRTEYFLKGGKYPYYWECSFQGPLQGTAKPSLYLERVCETHRDSED